MALVDVKEVIEAGVHFGHRASRWHPKMEPYIFGKRNLIHIIDVRQTVKGLVRASNFLGRLVATGKEVVFVGTKRQAKSLVVREAERCGMHYVAERWLGGTLTNYHTIRQRLERLEELEALEADGSIEEYSKKRISALRRERRKILRNLEGIRNLKQMPGCLVVVDVRREYIAVREARKIGIPVVALVDTDCNPGEVDIVIPGNDDAYRSIQVILKVLADSVLVGKKRYETQQAELERAREQERQEREAEKAAAERAAAERAAAERAAVSKAAAEKAAASKAAASKAAASKAAVSKAAVPGSDATAPAVPPPPAAGSPPAGAAGTSGAPSTSESN